MVSLLIGADGAAPGVAGKSHHCKEIGDEMKNGCIGALGKVVK